MPTQNEDIQLLSGSRRKLEVKVPGENRPLYIGLVFLAVAGGLWGGANFYFASLRDQLINLDGELAALESSRDRASEQAILVLDKRLALADGLVSNHLVWSEVLKKIQAATPLAVQFLGLRTNGTDGWADIQATAPSYTVVAKHLAALLADPIFIDISLNKISGLPSGFLEYSFKVSFNKQKLLLSQYASDKNE